MNVLTEWGPTFYAFLTVLTRVASFWVALPILRRGVPVWSKLGIAIFISLLVLPVIDTPTGTPALTQFTLRLLGEAIVGLTIGFMVSLIFSSLYLAGHLIDVQMGFGTVSLFDPQTGDHVPMVAQFQNAMAVLLFFTLNGHHALLAAVAKSFTVIPIGEALMNSGVVQAVFDAFAAMFILSVQIALPVVAAVFLTDVALGIMTRAVPQMNVFVVGFPVKISVGLIVYMLALPVIVSVIASLVGPSGGLLTHVQQLIMALGGGL